MASGMYNSAKTLIANGGLDLDTASLKVMLLGTGYTFDPDHDFVNDVVANELSATGYTGGFAGAGRKAATVTVSTDNTQDRTEIKIADLTWTALGGGNSIGFAVLIREAGGADSASDLIACFDLTDTPTNGSDITLDFDGTDGNIRIT